MDIVILVVLLLAAMAVIPFGLPGTWVMLGIALLHGAFLGSHGVSVGTIVGLVLVAGVAEIAEYQLSMSFTTKYGGSRRAGWGAIGGGIVGALVGLPVPLIGSLLGAFVGAFCGAFLLELTSGARGGSAATAAKGAVLGRAVALAAKSAAGVIMAIWIVRAAASG